MDKCKVIPKAPPLEYVAEDWLLRILPALGDQILHATLGEGGLEGGGGSGKT